MTTTVANDAFGRLRVGLGLLPLPLTLDAAGANPVNFSIVVTSVSGTCNTAAAATWTEVR